MAERMGVGEAAAKGVVAGLVAGMAINLVWQAGERFVLAPGERVGSPTSRIVRQKAEASGRTVTEAQVRTAAGAIYGGTMATYGALYGVVQTRLNPPPLATGMLLTGIMYALNFPRFGALPKNDIMPPPSEQRPAAAAVPIVAQLAFGAALPAVFAALSGGSAEAADYEYDPA